MINQLPERPWHLIEHQESFEIQDADDFHIAFIYFDVTGDQVSRKVRRRITKDQARAVAEHLLAIGARD